jgi:hypothetical protein
VFLHSRLLLLIDYWLILLLPPSLGVAEAVLMFCLLDLGDLLVEELLLEGLVLGTQFGILFTLSGACVCGWDAVFEEGVIG